MEGKRKDGKITGCSQGPAVSCIMDFHISVFIPHEQCPVSITDHAHKERGGPKTRPQVEHYPKRHIGLSGLSFSEGGVPKDGHTRQVNHIGII